MELRPRIRQVKTYIRQLWKRQPIKIERTEEGLVFTTETYEYDPNDEERVLLVEVDGKDTSTHEAYKVADGMALEYETGVKLCAITSEPLLVGGTQMYFTKPGYLGTIALNEETLLAGDVFNPSGGTTKREIPSEAIDDHKERINWDMTNVDRVEDLETNEDGNYLVPTEEIGDVVTLYGSKESLKTLTRGKLLNKLLKLKDVSWRQKLVFMGLGAGAGYIAQQQWG